MKTKNLKNILLLGIIILSVTISACKKNDQPSRQDMLVGTWNLDYLKVSLFGENNVLLGENREKVDAANASSVEFRKDGTAISDGDQATWKLSGDNLTVQYTEEGNTITENMTIKELTSSKLVLTLFTEDQEIIKALQLPSETKKLVLDSEYKKAN